MFFPCTFNSRCYCKCPHILFQQPVYECQSGNTGSQITPLRFVKKYQIVTVSDCLESNSAQ